jgi:hypothetical protein
LDVLEDPCGFELFVTLVGEGVVGEANDAVLGEGGCREPE